MSRTKVLLLAIGLHIVAALILVIYFKITEPKLSMGYGGSPGHMSPTEIEELYNKNRKP